MQQHGDKLDYDVLHWLIKETSVHSIPLSSPVLPRRLSCHHTGGQDKKYTIPKGHIVATSPPFANCLSSVYKDPNSFNPEICSWKGRGQGRSILLPCLCWWQAWDVMGRHLHTCRSVELLKQIIFKSQERLIKNLTSGGEYWLTEEIKFFLLMKHRSKQSGVFSFAALSLS